MTTTVSRDNSLPIRGQRFDTRTHRVVQLAGNADPVGDDQAERHSSWGALQECAPEGGKHRDPVATHRFSQIAPPAVAVALLVAGYLWEEHKAWLLGAGTTFAGVIGFAVWVRWPVAGA